MPIYAYRCTTCGHAQDMLQKISDPVLTVCPACGASTYAKQVTAAGFQLKGSGWYVTDFRGGNNGAKKDDAAKDDAKTEAKPDAKPDAAQPAGEAAKPAEAAKAAKPAEAPAASPAPAPAPAPSSTS